MDTWSEPTNSVLENSKVFISPHPNPPQTRSITLEQASPDSEITNWLEFEQEVRTWQPETDKKYQKPTFRTHRPISFLDGRALKNIVGEPDFIIVDDHISLLMSWESKTKWVLNVLPDQNIVTLYNEEKEFREGPYACPNGLQHFRQEEASTEKSGTRREEERPDIELLRRAHLTIRLRSDSRGEKIGHKYQGPKSLQTLSWKIQSWLAAAGGKPPAEQLTNYLPKVSSHRDLGKELKVLVELLGPETKKGKKALALKRQLKCATPCVFAHREEERPDIELLRRAHLTIRLRSDSRGGICYILLIQYILLLQKKKDEKKKLSIS
ncbi:hypothetical protein C2G38_2182643 [Gigaspora rosea]|uniref:Uncharacterized protein n=1 Tax=Gigaspora rosea TaxID=44941 RepID=A0A397VDW3_9GLOM|nr:hypothetical protein C2G38_2182643 [Gigaspora rosea]